MYRLDTAEKAIEAFESFHGLNVTIHDLMGNLSPFLKPNRFYHRSPLCLAVKAGGHQHACLLFENVRLRQDLADLPEGRMQVCHANLLEWVVPIFEQDKLAWVLFAGPRLPGKHLVSATSAQPTRWLKSPWAKRLPLPAPMEEDEGQLILEHLRQLAARLQKWAYDVKLDQTGGNSRIMPSDLLTTRQIAVRRFIEDSYTGPVTLPQLARKLCLSESRTSHFVRESCGTSFRELLIQKRLHAAMELLRQSGMSVLEVALASGFGDIAHFHRLFRRRIGTTPTQYRSSGQS